MRKKKFVVDRSKWRMGSEGKDSHGYGNTQLLNTEGYMCCLGFVCEQLGVPRHKLIGVSEPMNLVEIPNIINKTQAKFLKDILLTQEDDTDEETEDLELLYRNSNLACTAMTINDAKNTTRQEKEKQLIDLFKEYGHEIEFIGKYEDEPQDTSEVP